MIYLDNSSTAFPRAKDLGSIMKDCIENFSFNTNRTNSVQSYVLEEKIYDVRCKVGNFFNYNVESNVIFTNNITTALNIAINGILEEGDHVLISPFEHNAVLRTLTKLSLKSITYDIIPADINGKIMYDEINNLINDKTKAVICNHVSNVFGIVSDINFLGKFCRKNDLIFIVDSAQSAGILEIDMLDDNIDILCFTGHKALLGPQGIGGLIINDRIRHFVKPYLYGGTGSFSDSYDMPDVYPDKFEAGTLNIPGIIGLGHAIEYISKIGVANINNHEKKLKKEFVNRLKGNDNINIYDNFDGTGIVSISSYKMDNAALADILSNEHNIITRCGLHCSPLAHKTMGTFPKGTIRFSFGYFNTFDEVNLVADVINNKINFRK